MSLRRELEGLMESAAEMGYPGVRELPGMTPREIEWTLRAFATQEKRRMERLDALAWLTGRYAAVGVNAPGKYPKKPDGLRREKRRMTDAEMKRVFAGLAKSYAP